MTRHDAPVKTEDKVTVEPGKKSFTSPVHVLYQDAHILVIDKPSGLLTVSTEKEKEKTLYFQLNEWLKVSDTDHRARVFIVHRLDRDTSGLLVFAKDAETKQRLQKEWEHCGKRYYAVVEGRPPQEDTLRSYLAQNKAMKVYSTEKGDESKLAVTQYQVVRSNEWYSLLDIVPNTGRKNQIRVQLADIGHPVAGDEKYGAKSNPAHRLALHAYELSFKHPVTGKKMSFKSPLPVQLSNIVK